MLSKIDARNGAFGIVPPELEGAIITGNFWTYDINKDLGLDENYLNYLLFSDEFKEICQMSSAGVTNRRYLDENIFFDQKIPFPNIEVQQKIVNDISVMKNSISDYKIKIDELKSEIGSTISNLWNY